MYKKITETDFISSNIKYNNIRVTSIIVDIDGVLIDVRKSYNEAIKKTTQFITNYLKKYRSKNIVSDNIISRFRQSGGFNNDTDTSYAITLTLLLNSNFQNDDLKRFLFRTAENSDESGIISVEKFLKKSLNYSSKKLSEKDDFDFDKIRKDLNYPGPVGKSIVSTVFDEFFYGQKLFRMKYGFDTNYYFGKPLIENDKIIITNKTIKALSNKFNGKIAMVSGRSKIAAKFSLDRKFILLNGNKSIFLEDEKRRYAKPNPHGLIRVMKCMGFNDHIIYCGDSIEDSIMAKRAEREINLTKRKKGERTKVFFCGVYGCSTNQQELIKKFKDKNADFIIKSINNLPNVLNKV
ncbi:MAG TPA: HAD-IA family hydrolase [Nitrososphaeraceae archaeon]|nr:HAD-IA family hydrolase [Nitrososphaeraceae archaeon]